MPNSTAPSPSVRAGISASIFRRKPAPDLIRDVQRFEGRHTGMPPIVSYGISRRSAALTRRFFPTVPTHLAAAIPATGPCGFLALHLNDIIHGGGRPGNVRLSGHEGVCRTERRECERAGRK